VLENLTERLSRIAKTIRGEARLTEATLGAEVVGSLTPGQALVGVVHRELTALMGGEDAALDLAATPPAVVLLAGLQGSGKTTTAAKLAKMLVTERKKKPLLVSCDVYRPAAIEQLRTLAAQIGVDFFPSEAGQKPLAIALAALDHARKHYHDVLLVDTAGRLAIDVTMMQEITDLHAALNPVETLFVVDSMQGQDSVKVAKAFGDALPLTGIVLTKLDGDARGGAALSVRQVTGKPIKFAGVSEKPDGLELFHPERMASRILGMGDVLSLVEEARKTVDVDEAKKFAEKVKKGKGFDLEDFKQQIGQMRKMGGVSALVDKLPAQFAQAAQSSQMDEKQLRRVEGIINSMTPAERMRPEILKASRKRRIAAGAGVPVQEVNRVLNQFEQMQKVMKMMKGGNLGRMMRGMKGFMPGMR
jgi:signal recognition particle subunit SRP54